MQQFIGVKAIIQNNGKILLIRRSEKYKKDNIEGIWDIPGGRITPGEEPLDGLKREVMEETGLELKEIKRVIDVSTVFKNDEKQIVRITYLCKSKTTKPKLSDEHTEFVWIKPSDINFKLKDTLIEKAIGVLTKSL
jgi:8-oxo-dGTP diphosphatase